MTVFNSLRDMITRDYVERLRSLLSDGYLCVHSTQLPNMYYSKLRHHFNGNIITLVANFDKCTLKQISKGKVKFSKEY